MISWYFIIAMLVNFASTFAYHVLSRNEKVSDELVLITTRCIMASYALLFISVARLLLKGNIFYIVMLIIGAIVFALMFNIEKLPIWEDDGKE